MSYYAKFEISQKEKKLDEKLPIIKFLCTPKVCLKMPSLKWFFLHPRRSYNISHPLYFSLYPLWKTFLEDMYKNYSLGQFIQYTTKHITCKKNYSPLKIIEKRLNTFVMIKYSYIHSFSFLLKRKQEENGREWVISNLFRLLQWPNSFSCI